MADDEIIQCADHLTRRLIEGGMPPERAEEVAAIGMGLSIGDVIRTDGLGREIPRLDLSREAVERWSRPTAS